MPGITAEVLTTTDTWGVYTHGTRQLRQLMKNVRQGRLNAEATPEVVDQGPAWAIVDGHYAMPMVTSWQAMTIAMQKARESGVAYVGVRHSSHFGAAGYYAVMAAQAGHDRAEHVQRRPVHDGARRAGQGHRHQPHRVRRAGRAGETGLAGHRDQHRGCHQDLRGQGERQIHSGQLAGGRGRRADHDPSGYPERGAQLPMAGHKGYGLAVSWRS